MQKQNQDKPKLDLAYLRVSMNRIKPSQYQRQNQFKNYENQIPASQSEKKLTMTIK